MSLLDHGQWAFDVGYAYENMDLYGCYKESWRERSWSGGAEGSWGEWERPDKGDRQEYYHYFAGDCFRLMDFELDAALVSLEYGLCDNWDIYFRLGMARAEGDIAWGSWTYNEANRFYWYEEHADFGWGPAWQVGTNFTFCQNGPWTWGGRMQFGMADPDDDSWSFIERGEEGYYWCGTRNADIEMYEALAYIGPTYQPSDTWLLYSALGWQCERVTLNYTEDEYEYFEEEEDPLYRDYDDISGKLKHYSAIGIFGAMYTHPKARISADVLIGEAGKWGYSVIGQFPF
jgi:hypothetical protein